MPPGQYAKPPITEAVIELRFEQSVTAEVLGKFARAVDGRYPNAEQTYDLTAQLEIAKVGEEPRVKATQQFTGYKLVGVDSTAVVFARLNGLATIRLAPYCGWDAFVAEAKDNYSALKKITGYRNIVRISTRYINRIDIPQTGRQSVDVNDYVRTEPAVPKIIPVLHSYTTQFVGAAPGIGGQVVVNTGTVASPLIDHFSILLDLDLFREHELPQKDDLIWELFAELRREKNALFEGFVTDRAREIFDHV